jgi:hypothetical protein
MPDYIENDYRHSELRADVYPEDAFEAVVEVLLRWDGRTIGVLYIDDHAGRSFTATDVEVLQKYVAQAAIALAHSGLVSPDGGHPGAPASAVDASPFLAGSDVLRGLGTTTLDQRLTRVANAVTRVLDAEVCQVLLVKRPGFVSLEASSSAGGNRSTSRRSARARCSASRSGAPATMADRSSACSSSITSVGPTAWRRRTWASRTRTWGRSRRSRRTPRSSSTPRC